MNKTFEKELEKSRKLIFGVKEDSEISTRISGIYPAERIEQGVNLYKNTKAANARQEKEKGDSESATAMYNAVRTALQTDYKKIRRTLRYFYNDDPGMCSTLQCTGTIPTDFATWKSWVEKTLTAVASNDEVKNKIALFSFSDEKLDNMQSNLNNIDQLSLDAEREDGEAQQATVEKYSLYDELMAYCSDLRECLIIAFYDESERQKLEKVGIVVK